MPAKKLNSPKVNSGWFQKRLQIQKLSQRQFAKALKLDPSAVTLMLKGRRRISLSEAAEISSVLGAPIEEVLQNAGIGLGASQSKSQVAIDGTIDDEFAVRLERPKGRAVAPKPLGEDGLKVLRFQTAGSSLESFDGALVYFRDGSVLDLESVGRLSVVRVVKGRERVLRVGVLKRGYEPGRFNIVSLGGRLIAEDVEVESSNAVVWLRF